jgi:hypothetical protein
MWLPFSVTGVVAVVMVLAVDAAVLLPFAATHEEAVRAALVQQCLAATRVEP